MAPSHPDIPQIQVTHLDVNPNLQSQAKTSTTKLSVLSVSKLATQPASTKYWFKTRNVHLDSNRLTKQSLRADTATMARAKASGEPAQPQKVKKARAPQHPKLHFHSPPISSETKRTLISEFAAVKATGLREADVIDAFFDSLTVVEPTPVDGTRSMEKSEEVAKITPGILLAAMDLHANTNERAADQKGQTVEKGHHSTSEKAAQQSYLHLKNGVEDGDVGTVKPPVALPSLQFRVGNTKEATTRLPVDIFIQTVVNVLHRHDPDRYHVEYTMKVPTYHQVLDSQPMIPQLEPSSVRLDGGLSVQVPAVDPADVKNPKKHSEKNKTYVKILRVKENREQFMRSFRHNMSPLTSSLVKAKDPPESKVFPFENARVWAGGDFFFLVIEYKKKSMLSAVRQLAMQMTSVLKFNAGQTLSGREWPIYGFLVEDATVQVYYGWLEKVRNSALPDKVFIAHAKTPEKKEMTLNLRTSDGALVFSRILAGIREYGCRKFYNKAKQAVEDVYGLMSNPKKWKPLTKGYDAAYAAARAARIKRQIAADDDDSDEEYDTEENLSEEESDEELEEAEEELEEAEEESDDAEEELESEED